MANFGQILAGITLAGEALAAEQLLVADFKSGQALTQSQLDEIVLPIAQTVGVLVHHAVPNDLRIAIEAAVVAVINNYHKNGNKVVST